MKKNTDLHLSRITMTKSKNYATKNIRTRYSTLKKKNRITFIKITLWNISYRSRNEREIDREREREGRRRSSNS